MIIVIVIKIHLMIVSEVRMAASKVVAILGKMTTMMMMMMMMTMIMMMMLMTITPMTRKIMTMMMI